MLLEKNMEEAVIKVLMHILREQWDIIVHERTKFDVDAARRTLFSVTEKQEFSQSVAETIAGKRENDDDDSCIKELLAKALAEEFLQTDHPLMDWAELLAYWDAYNPFREEIKKALTEKPEACVLVIWRSSLLVFEHPECLLFGGEEETFLFSMKQWEKETDIQKLWGWGAKDFFPYEHNAFFFPMLLLPERKKDFLEIAVHLKSPVFLYDLFAGVCRRGEKRILLDLLQEAPMSVDDAESIQWNRSWIAPVLLDEIFHKVAEAYPFHRPLSDDEKREIQEIFIDVGNVLCDRIDGFFLACNYIKYLSAGRERNQLVVATCLETLGDKLHKAVKARFPRPDTLSVFFQENVDAIRKLFLETGMLWKKQDYSAYTELLAVIQFFFKEDEYLKEGRFLLETSLMVEDDTIHAYEAMPSQCHYDIAAMYLTSFGENVVKGWQETWRYFAMARCRSNFCYYDSESAAIRKRLNFLLLIALALLDRACAVRDWTMMDTLWESLWGIMEERLQYKAGKDDDFNEDYIKRLFLWKAMQIRKQNEEMSLSQENENGKLADMVLKLESYHEMYLQVLDVLACNGYFSNLITLSEAQREEMIKACHNSMEMCSGMDYREQLEGKGEKLLKNISRRR